MLTDGEVAYITSGTHGASHDYMRRKLKLFDSFERSVIFYNEDETH